MSTSTGVITQTESYKLNRRERKRLAEKLDIEHSNIIKHFNAMIEKASASEPLPKRPSYVSFMNDARLWIKPDDSIKIQNIFDEIDRGTHDWNREAYQRIALHNYQINPSEFNQDVLRVTGYDPHAKHWDNYAVANQATQELELRFNQLEKDPQAKALIDFGFDLESFRIFNNNPHQFLCFDQTEPIYSKIYNQHWLTAVLSVNDSMADSSPVDVLKIVNKDAIQIKSYWETVLGLLVGESGQEIVAIHNQFENTDNLTEKEAADLIARSFATISLYPDEMVAGFYFSELAGNPGAVNLIVAYLEAAENDFDLIQSPTNACSKHSLLAFSKIYQIDFDCLAETVIKAHTNREANFKL
jgi:hypothetical protein